MGCDGGTIPRRDELVRVKKKPETKDRDSELAFQWRCCAITQQVLQNPIVVCGLGRLYSKISLIEALLNKDSIPESAKHIKSLKDVKNLNLTPNPEYKQDDDKKGGSTVDIRSAPYICPVIGLEMSGKYRFIALWTCGCVFSERALKEISTTVCHKCQKPFEEEDIVVINGTEEDLNIMHGRMEQRQIKNKKKKEKKQKIKIEVEENIVNDNMSTDKMTLDPTFLNPVIKANSSAESTNKAPVESTNKAPVVPSNKASGSSSSSSGSTNKQIIGKLLPSKRLGAVGGALTDDRVKKAKSEYSVADDENATDVYKSLFTTHHTEKEQTRAHWITYNPFYN